MEFREQRPKVLVRLLNSPSDGGGLGTSRVGHRDRRGTGARSFPSLGLELYVDGADSIRRQHGEVGKRSKVATAGSANKGVITGVCATEYTRADTGEWCVTRIPQRELLDWVVPAAKVGTGCWAVACGWPWIPGCR